MLSFFLSLAYSVESIVRASEMSSKELQHPFHHSHSIAGRNLDHPVRSKKNMPKERAGLHGLLVIDRQQCLGRPLQALQSRRQKQYFCRYRCSLGIGNHPASGGPQEPSARWSAWDQNRLLLHGIDTKRTLAPSNRSSRRSTGR